MPYLTFINSDLKIEVDENIMLLSSLFNDLRSGTIITLQTTDQNTFDIFVNWYKNINLDIPYNYVGKCIVSNVDYLINIDPKLLLKLLYFAHINKIPLFMNTVINAMCHYKNMINYDDNARTLSFNGESLSKEMTKIIMKHSKLNISDRFDSLSLIFDTNDVIIAKHESNFKNVLNISEIIDTAQSIYDKIKLIISLYKSNMIDDSEKSKLIFETYKNDNSLSHSDKIKLILCLHKLKILSNNDIIHYISQLSVDPEIYHQIITDMILKKYKNLCDFELITDKDLNIKFSKLFMIIDKSITKIPKLTNYNNLNKIAMCNSVSKIEPYAFNNLTQLKEINLSNNIKVLPEGIFANCSELKTIKIPKSVTSIESKAFADCSSLKAFTFVSNIKNIGDEAFANCTSLTNVDCYYCFGANIGKDVFKNVETTIKYYDNYYHVTEKYIDDNDYKLSGHIIYDYAFANLTTITSLKLDFDAINNYAFNNCVNLKSITFSKSVASIDKGIFANCSNLTNIQINHKRIFKEIPEETFYNCSSLDLSKSEVSKILKNTNTIHKSAFKNCGLTKLNLENVKIIKEEAFTGCTKLTSIKLGNTRVIKSKAFAGCTNLKEIDLTNVVYVAPDAFDGCQNINCIDKPRNNGIMENSEELYKDIIVYINDEGIQYEFADNSNNNNGL